MSTLTVLFGSTEALVTALTPLAALGFLVFCLLYTPCIAAVASVRRELGGRWALGMVFGQFAVAWVAALAVRGAGSLAGLPPAAAWTAVVAAALAAGVALALCRMARRRRSGAGLGGCAGCAGAGTGACAGACAGAGALGEQAAAAGVPVAEAAATAAEVPAAPAPDEGEPARR